MEKNIYAQLRKLDRLDLKKHAINVFRPYSFEQLNYFYERALADEFYEMCDCINMVISEKSVDNKIAA